MVLKTILQAQDGAKGLHEESGAANGFPFLEGDSMDAAILSWVLNHWQKAIL